MEGPVIPGKLYFSEGFEYAIRKTDLVVNDAPVELFYGNQVIDVQLSFANPWPRRGWPSPYPFLESNYNPRFAKFPPDGHFVAFTLHSLDKKRVSCNLSIQALADINVRRNAAALEQIERVTAPGQSLRVVAVHEAEIRKQPQARSVE